MHDRQAGRLIGKTPDARMTAERWSQLQVVNRAINTRVAPREDAEIYGVSDYWTAGAHVGDCEDYMIAKKQALIAAGWAADQVLYAVVVGIETPHHAVLVVRTDRGDFVLDNLRDEILPWEETGYRFVVRQSSENPHRWVHVLQGPAKSDGNDRIATR